MSNIDKKLKEKTELKTEPKTELKEESFRVLSKNKNIGFKIYVISLITILLLCISYYAYMKFVKKEEIFFFKQKNKSFIETIFNSAALTSNNISENKEFDLNLLLSTDEEVIGFGDLILDFKLREDEKDNLISLKIDLDETDILDLKTIIEDFEYIYLNEENMFKETAKISLNELEREIIRSGIVNLVIPNQNQNENIYNEYNLEIITDIFSIQSLIQEILDDETEKTIEKIVQITEEKTGNNKKIIINLNKINFKEGLIELINIFLNNEDKLDKLSQINRIVNKNLANVKEENLEDFKNNTRIDLNKLKEKIQDKTNEEVLEEFNLEKIDFRFIFDIQKDALVKFEMYVDIPDKNENKFSSKIEISVKTEINDENIINFEKEKSKEISLRKVFDGDQEEVSEVISTFKSGLHLNNVLNKIKKISFSNLNNNINLNEDEIEIERNLELDLN